MAGDSLLLDTHVFYWWVEGERDRASATAWRTIERALHAQAVGVSEYSLWELAVKARKQHLNMEPDVRTWLRTATRLSGFGVVDADRKTLIESALLEMAHRDPADRIIIATALNYGMRLATADTTILEYAAENKRLRVLDVRA